MSVLKLPQQILAQSVSEQEVFAPGSILITQNAESSFAVKMASQHQANHIVDEKALNFESEKLIAENMILHPVEFLNQPIEYLLPESEAEFSFQMKCSSTENKRHALGQIEMFVRAVPGTKSIATDAIAALDEMYTNASKNSGVFYSKVDAQGQLLQARAGKVEVFARASKNHLLVGCVDTYGLLKIDSLMKKILGCYENGVAQSINMNQEAGAGIGSFLVYNSSMSYYLAVEPNKKTIIFCAFPLGVRTKHLNSFAKCLHLLTYERSST